MAVDEFEDDFRYPNRKPWLLVTLVAVALVVVLARYGRRREPLPDETDAREVPASAVVDKKPAPTSAPIAPVQSSRPEVGPLIREAQALEQAGDLVGARKAYLSTLKQLSAGPARAQVEEHAARVNVKLVMTPMAMPEKVDYVVTRGDSIEKIAKKFGTTGELIQESNRIANPNRIKIGDSLRIFTGKFRLEASTSRHDLLVLLNDEFFKRYSVGTGKFGKTPIGTFVITDKIKEPVWWRPDGKEVPYGNPDNILGTRWMTLKATGETPDVKGYGIHGTWDDPSIGKAESAGCLRMHNKDVEELFSFLPIGTTVVISK